MLNRKSDIAKLMIVGQRYSFRILELLIIAKIIKKFIITPATLRNIYRTPSPMKAHSGCTILGSVENAIDESMEGSILIQHESKYFDTVLLIFIGL